MRLEEKLTFGDVLLQPKRSRIKSRSEVNIGVELCKGMRFQNPFIPANMKSVISHSLLREVFKHKGLSLLHRFMSMGDQISFLVRAEEELGRNVLNYLGVSIGIKEEDFHNIKYFVETGVQIVCLDVAHAHSEQALEMTHRIAKTYPKLLLIAGNVATADGASDLFKHGADVVKVGIGSSGICSTRLETGAGVPQLSAIIDCHNRRKELQRELNRPLFLISDGGHSTPGDCVKALCFADMVMLGGMFSRTEEAAGETVEIDGQKFKRYEGSSTHKSNRVEGVKALVKIEGTAQELITRLSEGLQSGCSYQNAKHLDELKINPQFIRITSAGWKETQIHDVAAIEG